MFLCNIVLYSIGHCFHHQSHPQLEVVFALALSLHSFWSYFSTDLQWLGTYWAPLISRDWAHTGCLLTWGVHLSVSYHFAFSNCSWGSQGKNTEVICHSLLQWTTICQNSPPWPVYLGWPYQGTALSFIELNKAVVHMIRLVSFLWLWFSVYPLMEKDKMLMEASWWERLTEGAIGSCSNGWGRVQ